MFIQQTLRGRVHRVSGVLSITEIGSVKAEDLGWGRDQVLASSNKKCREPCVSCRGMTRLTMGCRGIEGDWPLECGKLGSHLSTSTGVWNGSWKRLAKAAMGKPTRSQKRIDVSTGKCQEDLSSQHRMATNLSCVQLQELHLFILGSSLGPGCSCSCGQESLKVVTVEVTNLQNVSVRFCLHGTDSGD